MFSPDDYLKLLQQLLPRGVAFESSQLKGTVFYRLLKAMATPLASIDAALDVLKAEWRPTQTQALLGEWEAELGLPDPCTTNRQQTLQERRLAVIQKTRPVLSPTKANLEAEALTLGYTISIETFTPFRCDVSTCDTPLNSDELPFTLLVHAPFTTPIYFRCDESTCDEPLEDQSNTELECLLHTITPAHLTVNFAYDL